MRKPIDHLLEVGKNYFLLGYYDRDLSVPFVEAYFFLGKNLFPDDVGDYWFFQNAQPFLDGVTVSTEAECEQAGVIRVPTEGLADFVDWQGLIDELLENKRMQDQGKFLSQVALNEKSNGPGSN